jgi:acyl-CoA thioesterase II
VTGLPSALGLLGLEYVGQDLYQSRAPYEAPWGMNSGHAAAQALYAAGLTVEKDLLPRTLVGFYPRQGDSSRPTLFRVERNRDRDRGSSSLRNAVAVQDGTAVFGMNADFAAPAGPGQVVPALGLDGVMPGHEPESVKDLPSPDSLPVWPHPGHASFELRPVDAGRGLPGRFWIRCLTELPDDPLLHAAMLTYMSDISTALVASARERAVTGPWLVPRIHFHRPARADGWIWQELTPHTTWPGWYTAAMYTADGTRIASVEQADQAFPPLPPR